MLPLKAIATAFVSNFLSKSEASAVFVLNFRTIINSNIMLNTPFNRFKPAALPLKKALSRLALGLATLFFAAVAVFCATAPTALAATIEPLHGIQVTEGYVTILVTSTGCTKKEDFISILEKSQPPIATFIRLEPDFCRAASRPVPIRFTLEEVGAKEFTVANLFEPAPGL